MELCIERAGALYLAERERFYTLNAYAKLIEKAAEKKEEEADDYIITI